MPQNTSQVTPQNTQQAYLLDNLPPIELLELVAGVVAKERYPSAAFGAIQGQIQQDFAGVALGLIVPTPTGDAPATTFAKSLIKAYSQLTDTAPNEGEAPPAPMPLAHTIIYALLNARNEQQPATRRHEEWLLVGNNLERKRKADIFLKLQQSTGVQMSEGKSRSQQVTLYHILDSHQRYSTFWGTVGTHTYEGCRLLSAHEHNGRLIFLSRAAIGDDARRPIAAEALAYFCQILDHGAPLFDPGDDRPANPLLRQRRQPAKPRPGHLLAAIDCPTGWDQESADASKRPTFYHLAALRFLDQISLAPPPRHIYFNIHNLENSETHLQELPKSIAMADPPMGYRLQLRKTQYTEPNLQEQERLQEKLFAVQYQLAALKNLVKPRPTLLRFTQRQLPILADILRRYPLKVLKEGHLLYAFHATPAANEGYHYVIVPPEVATQPLAPLFSWGKSEPSTHFWLDPFWACHYFGANTQTLIFVPHGQSLSPSLHSWQPAEIDSYMRERVQNWVGEDAMAERLQKIAHPLYVFEERRGATAELSLTILDHDAFIPLDTQLGWLNDNLLIHDKLETPEFIEAMADATAAERLARKMLTQADDAVTKFRTAHLALDQKLANTTIDMTKRLTDDLDQLVEQTRKTLDNIAELTPELRRLEEIYNQMTGAVRQGQTLLSQTEQEGKALDNHTENVKHQAEAKIKHANQHIASVQQDVEAMINRLRQAHTALQKRLNSNLSGGGPGIMGD